MRTVTQVGLAGVQPNGLPFLFQNSRTLHLGVRPIF